MSYSSGEALILAALQLHPNYDTRNSSRGKWGMLNSGKNAYYVILRPGPFELSTMGVSGVGAGGGIRQATWTTQLMVYQRYVDDGTTMTNLEARVDEVIAQLDKYRNLGDTTNTIQKARVMSGGEVEVIDHEGSLWARWIINVIWNEERSVTYAE
jgi:hypothetical protein